MKKTLGDFEIPKIRFDNLTSIFKEFSTQNFKKLSEGQKSERVNRALLDLIQAAETPCFLLPAVLEYIDRVNALALFETYAFLHFELWLNQSSGLGNEENLFIRGKITGKWVPRDAYQLLFPIGMDKMYAGSHFVTAHGSPDLDTTVSSFWGWIDAFSARVCQGLHLWNVPGGPPVSQTEIELLFNHIFGESVFEHLVKTRTTLALSGIDLMTQKGMERKEPHASVFSMDERVPKATVVVDEQGYYLGDWRSDDSEAVRGVIGLLNSCLRWFQTHLHVKMTTLFSKAKVSTKDLPAFIDGIFHQRVGDCEPAQEFSDKQRDYLDRYLKRVLNVKKGIDSTFQEFAKAMQGHSLSAFQECIELVGALHKMPIFDKSGALLEDRPRLFLVIEKIILGLEKAIQSIRSYVERLSVALKIKMEVFHSLEGSINARAEVEEIRSKMKDNTYLTVTRAAEAGKLIPLGIIAASDLHKNILGTVTLHDFCNREETKIPSYFEVISVIDHHKSHLQTLAAPMVLISDAQSSNVLCAELAFAINDPFSLGGMTTEQIQEQLQDLSKKLSSSSDKRVLQRVLQRLLVAEGKGRFFVHPMREYVEYLHFLYAILDDTDLLTKVSIRDLECTAALLNRLKSLVLREEVEIITLSDLPRDENFTVLAARRILQHPDMYSLYRKIYLAREESVDKNIALCAKRQPSSFFIDTKEQNGCVRVGQAKLFGRNYPTFAKHAEALRQHWHEAAAAFYHDKQEVDLYLQMISTLSGAEDLYKGTEGKYKHFDELWIWIPFTEQSIEHLKSFLNAFRACPQVIHNEFAAEFYGRQATEYEHIFTESFQPIPMKKYAEKKHASIAVLKFKAGTINSRKAMITPYLPRLVN